MKAKINVMLLLLVFLILHAFEAKTQTKGKVDNESKVVEKVNQLLEKLILDSKALEAEIKNHDLEEPNPNRETLQKQYKDVADIIIERKFDVMDSVAAYRRRKEIIQNIGLYSNWETKRDVLTNKKNTLDNQIIQYSAIIDINNSTENIRNSLKKAEASTKGYDREVISSFAASVRHISENAGDKSAYSSLTESMIIFKPGTNEKANDWLNNGMNMLGIAGGVVAYSGFQNDKNMVGASSVVVTAAIYYFGQKLLTKNKNKNSEVKGSIEALTRNVTYGNIIRADSANTANFKKNSEALQAMINYVDSGEAGEVKEDWIPSSKVIDMSHLVLNDMEKSLAFWNEIIIASNEALSKSKAWLSPEGRNHLVSNKTQAETQLLKKKDNLIRFRSKLYYFEKRFTDHNNDNKPLSTSTSGAEIKAELK